MGSRAQCPQFQFNIVEGRTSKKEYPRLRTMPSRSRSGHHVEVACPFIGGGLFSTNLFAAIGVLHLERLAALGSFMRSCRSGMYFFISASERGADRLQQKLLLIRQTKHKK